MPYVSKAQQRMFHYMESEGKMPKSTVSEFDEATDFSHLPERKKRKKMADGGTVKSDSQGQTLGDLIGYPKRMADGGKVGPDSHEPTAADKLVAGAFGSSYNAGALPKSAPSPTPKPKIVTYDAGYAYGGRIQRPMSKAMSHSIVETHMRKTLPHLGMSHEDFGESEHYADGGEVEGFEKKRRKRIHTAEGESFAHALMGRR